MYDLTITMDNVLIDVNSALETYLRNKKFDFRMTNVRTYDFNKNAPSGFDDFYTDASYLTIYKTLCDINMLKTAKPNLPLINYVKDLANRGFDILITETFRSEEVKDYKTNLFNQYFGNEPNITFEIHPYETSPKRMFRPTQMIITDNHTILVAYPVDIKKCLLNKPYNQEEYNNKYISLFRQETLMRCETAEKAFLQIEGYVKPSKTEVMI